MSSPARWLSPYTRKAPHAVHAEPTSDTGNTTSPVSRIRANRLRSARLPTGLPASYPPPAGQPGGRWSSACTPAPLRIKQRCHAGRQARLTAIPPDEVFRNRDAALPPRTRWHGWPRRPAGPLVTGSRPSPPPPPLFTRIVTQTGANRAAKWLDDVKSERWALRITGQPPRAARPAARIASTGAGLPVMSVTWAAAWCRSIGKPPATITPARAAAAASAVGHGW